MLKKNSYLADRIIIDTLIIIFVAVALYDGSCLWFKKTPLKPEPTVSAGALIDQVRAAFAAGYRARIDFEQEVGAGLANAEEENYGS